MTLPSHKLPFDIGTIHFVGIGGIGMSGIAEVMHNLGYSVRGSDISASANVQRLRQLGIPVAIGQAADNVDGAEAVVVSSAIRPDNVELQAARTHLIPVLKRAEMLAELMRLRWCVAVAGTHGKTTTTSMVANLFETASLEPTVINGGIINAYASNARWGNGKWMVVEADESDGTFLKLPATVAICTNLDPEHMDHYGDFEDLKEAFHQFISQVPFYGFGIVCIDDEDLQSVIARVTERRIITYGQNPQADIRARNISCDRTGSVFDVDISERTKGTPRTLERVKLPMPGVHNVLNALAPIALANEMGLSDDVIRKALESFSGVKRRFTEVGQWNGVTIIDDYGHHPVEIKAVLAAARMACDGNVVAIVQPHRYSRVHDLFDEFCTCFNEAYTVLVSDIYAAGEEPLDGISKESLVEGIRRSGHRHADLFADPGELPRRIADLVKPGDMVVFLGAGTITNWAHALEDDLNALERG